jgi:hypothetical protein
MLGRHDRAVRSARGAGGPRVALARRGGRRPAGHRRRRGDLGDRRGCRRGAPPPVRLGHRHRADAGAAHPAGAHRRVRRDSGVRSGVPGRAAGRLPLPLVGHPAGRDGELPGRAALVRLRPGAGGRRGAGGRGARRPEPSDDLRGRPGARRPRERRPGPGPGARGDAPVPGLCGGLRRPAPALPAGPGDAGPRVPRAGRDAGGAGPRLGGRGRAPPAVGGRRRPGRGRGGGRGGARQGRPDPSPVGALLVAAPWAVAEVFGWWTAVPPTG